MSVLFLTKEDDSLNLSKAKSESYCVPQVSCKESIRLLRLLSGSRKLHYHRICWEDRLTQSRRLLMTLSPPSLEIRSRKGGDKVEISFKR